MYKVTEGKVLQVSNTERSGYVRFNIDGYYADLPEKDFEKFVEFFIKTGKHIVPGPESYEMRINAVSEDEIAKDEEEPILGEDCPKKAVKRGRRGKRVQTTE